MDVYLSCPETVEIESHFTLPHDCASWQMISNSIPKQRVSGMAYQASVDSAGSANEFVYHRAISRDVSRFRADAYGTVRDFYTAASQHDNLQLAVQRKAGQ